MLFCQNSPEMGWMPPILVVAGIGNGYLGGKYGSWPRIAAIFRKYNLAHAPCSSCLSSMLDMVKACILGGGEGISVVMVVMNCVLFLLHQRSVKWVEDKLMVLYLLVLI